MKKQLPTYGFYLYLLLFLLVYLLFRTQSELTERWYSTGLYPYIGRLMRLLLGWIPFSVGDVLYTLLPLWGVYSLVRNFKKIRKKPLRFLLAVGKGCAMVITLFYLLWGFNYYRQPLSIQLGWQIAYTETDVKNVTERLILEANELHSQLASSSEQAVLSPLTPKEIYQQVPQGYKGLSAQFPALALHSSSIKSSLYNTVLTYMGYSGYLNPFTGEAQVNALAIQYGLPVTVAHEMAHQLGYASEKEANFIGFLATYHHPTPYFRYSATLFALRYCLREMRKISQEQHQVYIGKIRAGILENYAEAYRFWSQYQSPVEDVFKHTYDTFLKANAQQGGIQNYDYVTGLLIYYLSHNGR